MIVAPLYLTKDLPSRKAIKAALSKTEPSPEIVASLGEDSGNPESLQNPLINYR